MADFLRRFKIPSHTALYSLKGLEQEGWLAFNEQLFLPSSVVFTTDKNYLYVFEKEHPQFEPIIKALLRAYEGIFDYPASISEKILAGLIKKEPEEVKKQLTQLHESGILTYQPQKDTPQLFLLRNRIKAEDITINMVAYNKRKDQFHQRMKQMVSFINEDAQCRSRIIGSYFGDLKIRACGICDNCLKQKATQLSKEEFETVHHRIINIVKYEPLPAKELLLKLNGIKKENAWKVLEFLQAENKISVDKSGLVSLT
jgi:ATP-dependent DNA helicase RecQ